MQYKHCPYHNFYYFERGCIICKNDKGINKLLAIVNEWKEEVNTTDPFKRKQIIRGNSNYWIEKIRKENLKMKEPFELECIQIHGGKAEINYPYGGIVEEYNPRKNSLTIKIY